MSEVNERLESTLSTFVNYLYSDTYLRFLSFLHFPDAQWLMLTWMSSLQIQKALPILFVIFGLLETGLDNLQKMF